MELYLPEDIAKEVIKISSSFRVAAQVIGHVEPSQIPQLTIKNEHGEFKYS